MFEPIIIPLWSLLLLAGLSAWSVLVLILAPGMRWFLRRRINRMIGQLNSSLSVELPSFKLTRRQSMIERLYHDPKVQAAVASEAADTQEPISSIRQRVNGYVHEIVPSFNAYLYYRIGYTLARNVAQLLYRVRIGFSDDERLKSIDPRSTLVFVINHRSNMDYVLVSFLAAERVTLSYAVGEWARIWGLQQLIRAMGAFFVRRNSGDPLYRTVLSRYVQMATEGGVTQAMFPEGGLTVDGKLRSPRFGLLDYMLKEFNEREGDGRRDIVFVPVGLNYDRVLEDRTQLLKLHREHAARSNGVGAARKTLGFIWRQLRYVFRGGWHRFGYACVNFGAPISMRQWCGSHDIHFPALSEAQRKESVSTLAEELMARIGDVIPVLPVSLVASLIVENPQREWTSLELKSAMMEKMDQLQASGAHQYIPRRDREYAFTVGLRMLQLRGIVTQRDDLIVAPTESHEILAYYANSISHLNSQ